MLNKVLVDRITYYGDTKGTPYSDFMIIQVARRSTYRSNYSGLSDTTRKRKESSQTLVDSAGAIVHTINGMVSVMVFQSGSGNTMSCIFWIAEVFLKLDGLDKELLGKKWGFFLFM